MDSKHPVGLSAAENFDKTLGILVGACSGVSAHREDAFFVFNSSGLQFFLSLADISNFWVSVDDTWDGIVVDVATLA